MREPDLSPARCGYPIDAGEPLPGRCPYVGTVPVQIGPAGGVVRLLCPPHAAELVKELREGGTSCGQLMGGGGIRD